jgi:hypothetical protein
MNDKYTPPSVGGDESGSKHPSLNRRTILKLLVGTCLAIASLLYAVEIMSGAPNNIETAKERNSMFATKADAAPDRAIPPVDANLPARIETATLPCRFWGPTPGSGACGVVRTVWLLRRQKITPLIMPRAMKRVHPD